VKDILYKGKSVHLSKLYEVKYKRFYAIRYDEKISINETNLFEETLALKGKITSIQFSDVEWYKYPENHLIYQTSQSLKKYSRLYYIGLGLGCMGGIITYLTFTDVGRVGLIGPLMSLVGFGISLYAPSRIGKAGSDLERAVKYRMIQETKQDTLENGSLINNY